MNTMMIVINAIVFAVMELTGSTLDTMYMLEHGASYAPWILEYGQYWRLFTSMFMHFGISHLGNNMLVLFLLGDNVERAVGRWKYTVIYLMSGLAGSCLSFAGSLVKREYAVCAGASGAIFGIIGALFYIVAVNRGRLEDMTTRRLGIMIVVSLYLPVPVWIILRTSAAWSEEHCWPWFYMKEKGKERCDCHIWYLPPALAECFLV